MSHCAVVKVYQVCSFRVYRYVRSYYKYLYRVLETKLVRENMTAEASMVVLFIIIGLLVSSVLP